ncbi:MAG: DUF4236 domain-containing protein [Flavobacteriales bacterium]|nr:DUF4236 domain-containing protein [Flavobacteriales bacterium]
MFPGVVLNFSKQGVSTTVGIPGANVNFNRDGQFLNTGLPGTGIYDRRRIGGKSRKSKRGSGHQDISLPDKEEADKKEIATKDVVGTTSEGMRGVRDTLLECHRERLEIKKEIINAKRSLKQKGYLLAASRILIIGFIIPWFERKRDECSEDVENLEQQLDLCKVKVEIRSDIEIETAFEKLQEKYAALQKSEMVWDITSSLKNRKSMKAETANHAISREIVRISYAGIPVVDTPYRALHFENANGGDLYFLPAFLALIDSANNFGLVAIREVKCRFSEEKMVEHHHVPSDAKIDSHTWMHANKDGSRDKRYKNNPSLPICHYGRIDWTTTTGLNESYLFSNIGLAREFAAGFSSYQKQMYSEIKT